jgi:sarcosine oxidase subunit alpha
MPEVRIIRRGVVFGYHDHNFLTIRESLTDHLPLAERKGFRERLWRVRAAQVVLATGAHERPLVFGNNDLPGVMLSSALADYAELYGVRVGRQVVLVTTNDSAYADARLLQAAGARSRWSTPGATRWRAARRNRRKRTASRSCGALCRCWPRAPAMSPHWSFARWWGKASGEERTLACDAIGMAGGWNPAIHLYSHSGGKARWDDGAVCFKPGAAMPQQASVGACNAPPGFWHRHQPGRRQPGRRRRGHRRPVSRPGPKPTPVDEMVLEPTGRFWIAETGEPLSRRAKAFVDYQNDVSASDIELAIREGFESIEHIKRYTAMGFGTDQGKLGNINGMALAARALGKPIDQVGTTTFRPNYLPITFGLFAGLERGELFDPARKTSPHDCSMWRPAACSRTSASGSARGTSPSPARTCTRP